MLDEDEIRIKEQRKKIKGLRRTIRRQNETIAQLMQVTQALAEGRDSSVVSLLAKFNAQLARKHGMVAKDE